MIYIGYLFFLVQMILARNSDPPMVNVYSDGKVIDSLIYLSCSVVSYSPPIIYWLRNGDLICIKSNVTSRHNQQHYWNNCTDSYPDVNDNYTCIAQNAYGKASDSYIMPCFAESCFQWDKTLEENITVKVGQDFPISCVLSTINQHIEQCFEFGVTHHSRRYASHTLITMPWRNDRYWIQYWYNISNARINDTGIYTCYYHIKNFTKTSDNTLCPNPTVKHFNLRVIDQELSENHERNIKIAIIVSCVSVFVGIILVLSLFCLRKKKLKLQRLYDSEPELRWDVFISYCSKDFDCVKEFRNTLESHPFNLTVCLHQRDWEVGRTILDNMYESIYCSNKTLLILSKSYLESSFCLEELNIAIGCEKVMKDKVIVIKLDDVSLRKLPKTLKQKSYLDFSNDEQRKHYKTKLLKVLPKRDLNMETRSNVSGPSSQKYEEEIQSVGSGNETQSEGSGNDALFHESGEEDMDCVQLHEIQSV